MSIGILIFDFDGTLFDPFKSFRKSLALALESRGMGLPSDEVLRTFIGPPLHVCLKNHFGLNDSQVQELVTDYRAHHSGPALDDYEPYPHLIESLERLAPKFEINIASSKPQRQLDQVIDRKGVRRHFRSIVGAEPQAAPEKDGLVEKALGQGERSRAVMIGDRFFDIEAGRRCGLKTIGVTWGYGTADELRGCGANALCHSLLELSDRLLDPNAPLFES